MIYFILFVMALVIFGTFLQANSIAIIVNEQGDVATLDEAFSICNDDRDSFRADGKDCDPCEIRCVPSRTTQQPNGLYTFSYPAELEWYAGTYTDLDCQRWDGFSTLDIVSFCHDTIRICDVQDDYGKIKTSYGVSHGRYTQYEYKVFQKDCETGDVLGDSTSTTSWVVTCDSGYVVSGRRTSVYEGSLGDCVLEFPQDDPSAPELSGELIQAIFDDTVAIGEEVTIRGSFKVDVSGRYYVYGTMRKDSFTPLSIVTGSGVQDACGSDLNTAGLFKDLNSGDVLIFSLNFPSIGKEGMYILNLGVRNGCNGDDIAFEKSSIKVIGKEQLIVEVIEESVAEAKEAKETAIKEIIAITQSSGDVCTSSDDFSVGGCAIAECVDGKVSPFTKEEVKDTCDDSDLVGLIGDTSDDTHKKALYDTFFSLSDMQTKIIAAVGSTSFVLIALLFMF